MKVVFVIAGCVLILIGGIGTLIIVDMFQHPGASERNGSLDLCLGWWC